MIKTTLTSIKNEVAKNANNLNNDDYFKMDIERVAYSCGVYGINGLLFIDKKTNQKYKITSRCNALYIFS